MEELAARGGGVHVIMNTCLEYTPRSFKRIDITVLYKRKKLPPASYLFKREIKKNIAGITESLGQNQGIDWIHIHGDMHLPAAVFLKHYFKTKLFFAFRANDIRRARIVRKTGGLSRKEYCLSLLYDAVNRRREALAAREADLVTIQNKTDRDDFIGRTGYDKTRTVVIPGNIGPPRFTPEWKDRNVSREIRKLLFVGILSLTKGLQYLLKALSILQKRGYPIPLVVLGKTENAGPVFELVKSLNLREQISFEGYAPPFPYLASCDLLVYPTLYDAFPDTVLEALHTACPVIASAAGGIPDLLHYDELLFPSGDAGAIADRVQLCVDSPDQYRRIRELCAKRAPEYRFDWAEQFENAMADATAASQQRYSDATARW
jgi:glycosyltransferase involved in cell wall biosynthesis